MFLPANLIRNEVAKLQVAVYNYLNVDMKDISVKLFPTKDFKIAINSSQGKFEEINDINGKLTIPLIKPQSGETVSFLVTPVQVGLLTLIVKGSSSLAGDTEKRTVRVKPEGIEEIENMGLLIDTREKSVFQGSFKVKAPIGIVPGSEFCKVQLVGDFFGSSLNNLARLINRPCGCGEQNMLGLTSNIYALKYLLSISKSRQIINRNELIDNAKQNIEYGYQNELTYMHKDGSFSAFGESDSSGSSWLTAFVVKSFSQAALFMSSIDQAVVDKSIDWLLSQQKVDGSFNEPGNVIHKDMQGGINSQQTITAFITASLFESSSESVKVKNALKKAIYYLEQMSPAIADDRYSLGLVTYALQLGKSSLADQAFKKLKSYSVSTSDGNVYWPSNPTTHKKQSYSEPQSSDIELTSYALLTYLLKENGQDSLPIVKWLLSKSNSLGAYSSTQNTVLALQALSGFRIKMLMSDENNSHLMRVNVTLKDFYEKHNPKKMRRNVVKSFEINERNQLVLQTWELPSCDLSQIDLNVTDKGLALFQITLSYNLPKRREHSQTLVIRQTSKREGTNSLAITTCLRYNEMHTNTQKKQETGMMLIEASLLSGYEANKVELNNLVESKKHPELKLVELSPEKDKVVFYLNKVDTNMVCFDWKMLYVYPVSHLQASVVKAYDYYRPTIEISTLFEPPNFLHAAN